MRVERTLAMAVMVVVPRMVLVFFIVLSMLFMLFIMLGMFRMVPMLLIMFGMFRVVVMLLIVLGMFRMILMLLVVVSMLGMVVMLFFVFAVFRVLIVIVMGMRVECRAFANGKLDQIVSVPKFEDRRARSDILDRLCQEGFELRANPDDQIRFFQVPGRRRAEAMGMRGGGAVDDDSGLCDAIHHGRDEGVKRFDRHHDIGFGKGGRPGQENRGRCKRRRSMEEHGNTPIRRCNNVTRWRNAITYGLGCRKWQARQLAQKSRQARAAAFQVPPGSSPV